MSDETFAPQGDEPEGNRPPTEREEGEAQSGTAAESGGEPTTDSADSQNGAARADTAPEPPAARMEDAEQPEPEPEAPREPAKPAGGKELDAAAEFETALEAFEGGTTGTSYDEAFRPLSRGELLTATVIQVDRDKAFVDLGTKSEGVVPLDELSSQSFESAEEIVKVGDEIQVVVLNPQGREGNPIVSKKRADFEATWDRIIEEHESGETIKALVTERVRGGLVVDLGVRGFVPGSQVGTGQLKNLDKFVGQTMQFKVIEVDRDRRKVILSNRQADQEEREARKREIFHRVKPGEVMDGTVRRLVEYGAFVDLGGVDGLLHVSEMSWSRVDHPREVLKEGDKVKVMVLRLDSENGRISLGRRQVLPDPWTSIRENYTLGQRLKLPVSRVVQSGAFVKLPEGAEAFIPISEMAHRRITKPSEVVEAGMEVDVQVIDMRPDERRMVLSIRALLPYEERQHHQQQREEAPRRRGERQRGERHEGGGRHHQQAQQAGSGGGGGGGGTTIGERLSALKGLGGFEPVEEEPDQEKAPKEKREPKAKAAEAVPEAPEAKADPAVEPEAQPEAVEDAAPQAGPSEEIPGEPEKTE